MFGCSSDARMSRSRFSRSASPRSSHATRGSFNATWPSQRSVRALGEPHRRGTAGAQLTNQTIRPDEIAAADCGKRDAPQPGRVQQDVRSFRSGLAQQQVTQRIAEPACSGGSDSTHCLRCAGSRSNASSSSWLSLTQSAPERLMSPTPGEAASSSQTRCRDETGHGCANVSAGRPAATAWPFPSRAARCARRHPAHRLSPSPSCRRSNASRRPGPAGGRLPRGPAGPR